MPPTQATHRLARARADDQRDHHGAGAVVPGDRPLRARASRRPTSACTSCTRPSGRASSGARSPGAPSCRGWWTRRAISGPTSSASTSTRRPSRPPSRRGRRSRKALDAGIDVTHLDSHMGALQFTDAVLPGSTARWRRSSTCPSAWARRRRSPPSAAATSAAQLDADGVVYPDYLIHGGRLKDEAMATSTGAACSRASSPASPSCTFTRRCQATRCRRSPTRGRTAPPSSSCSPTTPRFARCSSARASSASATARCATCSEGTRALTRRRAHARAACWLSRWDRCVVLARWRRWSFQRALLRRRSTPPIKLIQSTELARIGLRSMALSYPARDLDPAEHFLPFEAPFVFLSAGKWQSIFSSFYAVLAAPLVPARRRVARRAGDRWASPSPARPLRQLGSGRAPGSSRAAALLATPVWFYGLNPNETPLALGCAVRRRWPSPRASAARVATGWPACCSGSPRCCVTNRCCSLLACSYARHLEGRHARMSASSSRALAAIACRSWRWRCSTTGGSSGRCSRICGTRCPGFEALLPRSRARLPELAVDGLARAAGRRSSSTGCSAFGGLRRRGGPCGLDWRWRTGCDG